VNRSIGSLLLILAIQCALVATVYWPPAEPGAATHPALLPFDPAQIDEIYVGDEFDNETVLARAGEHWLLPELEQLPADRTRVDKLLAALATGEQSWPVADSIAARQRFRVADYRYRRRITLLHDGDVLGVVLLGSSPGFRKVYARNESQDSIYSIRYSAHDAPGNSGGWLDHNLLQVRTPVSITADTWSVRREGTDWISGIGATPEPREMEALLAALRQLQISGLASEDEQRDLAAKEADLVFTVDGLAGRVSLELLRQGARYFIHSSEYPLFFTLAATDYDRLAGIDPRLISGDPQE